MALDYAVKLSIIPAVYVIIWLIIGLSCYFAGYIPRHQKNQNLIETTGFVVNMEYRPTTCYESCNCRNVCTYTDGKSNCHMRCDTCAFTCYDYYVYVNYTLLPEYNYDIGSRSAGTYICNTDDISCDEYTIGEKVNCYYNVCLFRPKLDKHIDSCEENSGGSELVLSKYSSKTFYAVSIMSFVFLGLYVLTILGIFARSIYSIVSAKIINTSRKIYKKLFGSRYVVAEETDLPFHTHSIPLPLQSQPLQPQPIPLQSQPLPLQSQPQQPPPYFEAPEPVNSIEVPYYEKPGPNVNV